MADFKDMLDKSPKSLKEIKQEQLRYGFLIYTETNADGLWIDPDPVESIGESLARICIQMISHEILDKNSVESLRLICSEIDKSPNKITIERLEHWETIEFPLSAEESPKYDPYIDLMMALMDEPYRKTTFAKYHEILAKRYPKLEKAVKKYHECLINKDSDLGFEQLYKLYMSLDDSNESFEAVMSATALMGYEAYITKTRLPFNCVWRAFLARRKNESLTRARSYPYICKLFEFYDAAKPEDILNSGQIISSVQSKVFESLVFSGDAKSNKFDLSGDEIMETMYFRKYYRRRRKGMCELLSCEDDELAKILYSKKFMKEENATICEMLQNYGVQPVCFDSAWVALGEDEENAAVIVDQDVLPKYFLMKLERELSEIYNEGGEEALKAITKRQLFSEIGADSVEEDVRFFSQIAFYDTLALVINQSRALYYTKYDFFKENSGGRLYSIEMQQKMNKYREDLEKARNEISALKKKNHPVLPKAKSSNEKLLMAEVAKANKENDDLQEENNKLQHTIDELEEYIELLENARTANDDESLDVAITGMDEAILHSIRIVFVCGDVDIKCPDLRREFPDSTIIESATQSASMRKTTDLVVYFTKHISHSMFFRAKSAYEGVPEYFFNGTNIDKLKSELSVYVQKMSKG